MSLRSDVLERVSAFQKTEECRTASSDEERRGLFAAFLLEDFHDSDSAADVLGLTPDRVRVICKDGRLGFFFLGQWWIGKRELKEFAKLERSPGRPPGKVDVPAAGS